MRLMISTGVAALALVLSGCGGNEADGNMAAAAGGGVPIAPIPAPNGGDWTQMIAETPEGGFRMGNPDAPVKVVEFGSLTCHVCAEFAEKGMPALTENYVKTGRVSFELRNFVRDPADLGAAMLSRCGGPTPFFQISDQMFATQKEWLAKLQTMTPAEQQQIEAMSPLQRSAAFARKAGLIEFVGLRGIPAEKAQSCLASQATLDRLVGMTESASKQYTVSGTPTFLINGEVVPNAAGWPALEPAIRSALN